MRVRHIPARQWVLVLLAGWATAYVATHLEFGTNVTHFMPDESASELAWLAGQLTDSELTRTWVLSVGASDPAAAREAARELAAEISGDPAVAWLRSGSESREDSGFFELYYPRRHYFLTPEPEEEIPRRVSPEALAARADQLRLALAQPGSEFMDSWLEADPLGGFEAVLLRLRSLDPGLRKEEGQFMSPDGKYALVLMGTRASAFDSGAHGPLLDRIETSFEAIRGRRGSSLTLEQASAHRFAVHAERQIRGDVFWVASFSFVGVAALFFGLMGSMRSFALVILPPLAGILGGLASSLFVFGAIDGLTIVFGISLMGVAIDYSIHLLVHHQFGPAERGAWKTRDTLRISLVMGALTTMASFVGLGLTPFPAFREMAFFAVSGLACAVGVTLWSLPDFLHYAPLPPPRSVRAARWLEEGVERLRARRGLLWVPVALVVAGLPCLSLLQWTDDLSELSNLDPALQAEDRRVRERASSMDGGRFAITVAADREALVRQNDEVARRLEDAVEQGHLEGFNSLHRLIWSPELQHRNWTALASDPGLEDRLEEAFTSRGFRPGLFENFLETVSRDLPPPLVLDDFEGSSLQGLVDPYEFPLGDRFAAVAYLRGVVSAAGIAAALEGLEHARLFDQEEFLTAVYREFREMTLRQMLLGGVLVILILVVRYRSLRLAVAACLPALLVGPAVLEIFALVGVQVNLLHVLSLILVLGMGVDYWIFLLDAAERSSNTGPTLLGLVLACMTTIFVFGALIVSSQPALYSVGLTTGVGIFLALVFSPVTLLFSPTRSSDSD